MPRTFSSILTVLNPNSSSTTHDTEAGGRPGSRSIELDSNPTRNHARELMTEISNVRIKVLPHLDQPRTSQTNDSAPGAISVYAKQTNTALTELEAIIKAHQANPSPSMNTNGTGLDQETFHKAEEAIDTFRHTQLKLHQRSVDLPKIPAVDMGLESVYQKGQNWLLSVSATNHNHADALLWQFTNSHLKREDPIPISSSRDTVGGSNQLWPPTSRTMRQTRSYLSPKKTRARLGKGRGAIKFDGCTHSLGDLKDKHRDWAIDELKGNEMSAWERDLIGSAVTRSGGEVPPMTTGDEEERENLGSDEGTAQLHTSTHEGIVVAGPSRPRPAVKRGGKGKERVF